jgi:hypothetical protein
MPGRVAGVCTSWLSRLQEQSPGRFRAAQVEK